METAGEAAIPAKDYFFISPRRSPILTGVPFASPLANFTLPRGKMQITVLPQQETPEFGALFQHDIVFGIVVNRNFFAGGGSDQPGEYRRNACHNRRADQNHGKTADFLIIEKTDNAFVAGKKIIHIAGGQRIDRKQLAGDEQHFFKLAGQGHMHAVIVARRKIGGGKAPVFKICGVLCCGRPGSGSRL